MKARQQKKNRIDRCCRAFGKTAERNISRFCGGGIRKDRMLVHSETERALDATNALARNVAERENLNPKPESADKTALNAAIKDAEALKKKITQQKVGKRLRRR